MEYDFSINPSLDIQVISIGEQGHTVIIVDDLLAYPEQLVNYACEGPLFQTASTDYYPGIRKPIEGKYSRELCHIMNKSLQELFNLKTNSAPNVSLCALSITTTEPKNLRPIQCLPHFDSSNSFQFAVVHYLCNPVQGGTSFYRHCQTGYESITENTVHHYARTLKEEVMAARFMGGQYMNGAGNGFECIATVDARFNRAIFYHGNLLHSGNINPDNGLNSDPRTGRLTANTFINFVTH